MHRYISRLVCLLFKSFSLFFALSLLFLLSFVFVPPFSSVYIPRLSPARVCVFLLFRSVGRKRERIRDAPGAVREEAPAANVYSLYERERREKKDPGREKSSSWQRWRPENKKRGRKVEKENKKEMSRLLRQVCTHAARCTHSSCFRMYGHTDMAAHRTKDFSAAQGATKNETQNPGSSNEQRKKHLFFRCSAYTYVAACATKAVHFRNVYLYILFLS